MNEPIRIPKLGVSMQEGHLIEWLVEDGATVTPGQAIYVLETDKIDSEVEATVGGVIRCVAPVDEDYQVGDEIGYIEVPG